MIIVSHDNLPHEAYATVDEIEALGFKWHLNMRYLVPGRQHRVQIRDEEHYAPKVNVTEYAAAMARGDTFPPVVLTADGYLVDGNTRVEAARANHFPHIAALILDRDYEEADSRTLQNIDLLGASLNAKHGTGLDKSEKRRHVISAAQDGRFDPKRIAARLRMTVNEVNKIINEKRGEDRAQSLGIQVSEDMPRTQLLRFGQSTWLNNKPFFELFNLTQDSGLKSTDLNELFKQIRGAGSDEKALEIIAACREERRDQISEYRATGKSRIPIAGQLRQKLGFILNYEANPRELIEHNRALTGTHLDVLERAVTVLTVARAFQGGVS